MRPQPLPRPAGNASRPGRGLRKLSKPRPTWTVPRANSAEPTRIGSARQLGLRVLSQQEIDACRSAFTRLQGRVGSARAHLNLLKAGSRAEDIAEAAADLQKAKANLELLEHGSRPEDIASAEAHVAELAARVAELKVNLQEAVILAAEPVVVEVLAVRKGDIVTANQPVIRVLRADDLWVKVYVPETELGRVRLRQTVVVTIDSYPDRRFEGRWNRSLRRASSRREISRVRTNANTRCSRSRSTWPIPRGSSSPAWPPR